MATMKNISTIFAALVFSSPVFAQGSRYVVDEKIEIGPSQRLSDEQISKINNGYGFSIKAKPGCQVIDLKAERGFFFDTLDAKLVCKPYRSFDK